MSQNVVCTNSFSYQYGETATATTSNTKSWSESSTQELTIGVKMKDAFEHSGASAIWDRPHLDV